MSKVTYQAIIGMNLMRKSAEPGDILTLTIRNEECADGIYKQAKRLMQMFLHCYNFYPESIAIHPDHLALLKKQGKTLDILIDEKAAELVGKFLDMTELPQRVPLVADESLDLFTAVARYAFPDDVQGLAMAGISALLGMDPKGL